MAVRKARARWDFSLTGDQGTLPLDRAGRDARLV